MNDNQQTLTLDGQIYAMSDLPPVARDTLISIQFVEARALKAELAQTPGTVSSTTPSP